MPIYSIFYTLNREGERTRNEQEKGEREGEVGEEEKDRGIKKKYEMYVGLKIINDKKNRRDDKQA